jgi:glutamine amidotransferase-like uncharacterized protein
MRIAYLSGTFNGLRLGVDGLKRQICASLSDIPALTVSSLPMDPCPLPTWQRRLDHLDILILSGVIGEVSPYPDFLTDRKLYALQKAIEQQGLHVVGICAAAYYMSKSISYSDRNGNNKERAGLGWVDAAGIGAVDLHDYPHGKTTSIRPIQISITSADGSDPTIIRTCYADGPALQLNSAECVHPAVEILAEFHQTALSGAAIIRKKMGNGSLTLLSALPYFSASDFTLSPDCQSQYPHIVRVKQDIAHFERERQELWRRCLVL